MESNLCCASKGLLMTGTSSNPLVCILGPTAAGKTRLAAKLAATVDGEVISADSRQVYRGMDIGTGKDLEDYVVETESGSATRVAHHLIDIVEPGEPFSVFDFQRAFCSAYESIRARQKLPVLCGGSGMYLEAVLSRYRLVEAGRDEELRAELAKLSDRALADRLRSLGPVHNTTDICDRERLMRAIEIAEHTRKNPSAGVRLPETTNLVLGFRFPRSELKKRIEQRLRTRLRHGMIEEVRTLLDGGLTAEQLDAYGLEYRFVTAHVTGALNRNDMFQKLRSAIWSFAKRQETWFRRMERRGTAIHWLDGRKPVGENVSEAVGLLDAEGMLP
jgi:tRNA dimethylallyltransferase